MTMTTTIALQPYIRWLIASDMQQVVSIEQCTADPWSEADIAAKMKQRPSIGMVCELNEIVVGYMIYDLHRTYLDLARLAVCPFHQRCGIGTVLIDKLYSKLSSDRRRRIVTSVSDGNLDAHLWLRANGFRATGCVRGDRYRFVRKLQHVMP